MQARGFIVANWEDPRPSRSGPRILVTGRLEDGRSFAAMTSAPAAAIFVAAADSGRAGTALKPLTSGALVSEEWTDLPGAPLARFVFPTARLGEAERLLTRHGIPVRERELPRASEALVPLGITGPVAIEGEATPGRRVDLVFVEPRLRPSSTLVPLRWMALDIETDRAENVVAVSLTDAGGAGEVLFVGPTLAASSVTSFNDERALLLALAPRIRKRDPDVITGWNVIDFDLRVLAKRFAACGLPFDIGRTADGASVHHRDGRRTLVRVPGRATLDALRLVRASGERLEEQSLEAVARAVLGHGKTVALHGRAKLDELDRLRREDPKRFCAYCLRDSELVLEILAKTGLDALTAKRAALTGVALDLAWTSIPAFERAYGAELRARHVAIPSRHSTTVSGAAGGTVLDASAGLFSNVVVFDFRSLYPSLIRTFNIDPLAHARAVARPRADDLVAPNGARFERRPGPLPEIIARYAAEREAALTAGDETAAYVYKILQNSFYGVLGASTCRYARTELAAAITSFGKLFLTAGRAWFEERGHRVLYGDTDSLFVVAPVAADTDHATLTAFGSASADALNRHLTERIAAQYGVTSHLRLRCEKVYRRFLIPRLKGELGSEGRGRAKGYAGLKLLSGGGAEVEVRGMEAVRSDFTPLARRFQVELLAKLFAGAVESELTAFCRDLAARLRGGELDSELVYRKSLRRPAAEYDSATPQVRAARLLGWVGERGRVSYVMTRAGAEPADARSSAALDYEHYLENQLLPIASAMADVLGADAGAWFGSTSQLELFTSSPA